MAVGLVLYFTVYGNTEKAARAICEGLSKKGVEAECKSVRAVKPGELRNYDFLVFGSPTHYDGVPEEMERFLRGLRREELRGKKAAAFDTRYEDASKGGLNVLEGYLRRLGMTIVKLGLAALLPSWAAEGPLKEGELEKCKAFGESLAPLLTA